MPTPLADIFNSDAFSMVSLTKAINAHPHQPKRIESMGIFQTEPIATTTAMLDENAGTLSLIPNQKRGGPAFNMTGDTRKARPFETLHLPVQDLITPKDIQDIRAFGSGELAGFAALTAQKLGKIKNSIAATIEHLRVGALKGQVLDSDGSTVLLDLFTEYGISQTVVDFLTGTATTDIKAKCLSAKRSIETALGNDTYDHIHALCSAEFFDDFTGHALVKEAYARWENGAALRDDMRSGFTFGGIVWEEYRGAVNGVDFIPDGDARIFPVGVQDLFMDFRAPGNFMGAVNTMGQDFYARQYVKPKGEGVELLGESNPLPVCVKPAAIIRAHSSN